MAFKMKPFSGFGNSPMKNIKNFEKFQAQKQKAKDFVEKLKPQIKKGNLSTTAKTKMVKQTAKGLESQAKTKMVKQVAKKGLGALARRSLGPAGIALTAYDIAKTAKKAVRGLKRRAKSGNVNIGRKI